MGGVDLAALALLGVVLAVLAARAVTRERREYARFKRLRSTVARQAVYRRWLQEGVFALGGLAIATIVGAWSDIPRALAEAQTWPAVAVAREWLASPLGLGVGVAGTVAVLALLILPVLALRGTDIAEAPTLGDIRALLPRSRGELPYGVGLSLNAGVSEELLFRLGLPALVFGITGNALVAFVFAAIVFGLLHVYQGPVGILASTLIGVVFTALYLVTGSILAPIVLHALVDLRSMVLIPVVLGKASKA